MSAVRMCDKCGTIFPEGAEGSAVLQGTMMVKDERTGRVRQEQTNQDACPECASGKLPKPRIAVGSVAAKSDTDTEQVETAVRRSRSTLIDASDDESGPYTGPAGF